MKLLVLFVATLFVIFTGLPVWAQDDVASINATVFPEVVSIEIPAGCESSIDYGTLSYGSVNQDPKDGPSLCVKNNGSVNENFHIAGYDMEPSDGEGIPWSLACTTGTDQYVHKFAPGDTTQGATFSCLTYSAGDNELAHDVALGGTQDFKLRIDMPTESDSYEEHTTTVNVTANAL